jgi:hypothetical protein
LKLGGCRSKLFISDHDLWMIETKDGVYAKIFG